MTNYEAVKADLLTYTASRLKVEKEILRVQLEPGGLFELENEREIATVVVRILRGFVHLKSESEGGLSNAYDPEELKQYLMAYAWEHDLEELVSDITNNDAINDRSDAW